VAKAIAERLKLRYIEMDRLSWRPNWTMTPDDELRQLVDAATRGEGWVLDGNYSQMRDLVWLRANTIVWLDYSFPRVFGRLLWRTIRRVVTREELWGGCRERFFTSFFSRNSILLWCLQTYWRRKREYPELLVRPEYAHLQWIRFRHPCDTSMWLTSIPERRER